MGLIQIMEMATGEYQTKKERAPHRKKSKERTAIPDLPKPPSVQPAGETPTPPKEPETPAPPPIVDPPEIVSSPPDENKEEPKP
jgi:hypothetical protein